MIECTENYVWYKKRKKRSFKRFFSVVLILAILICIYMYYKRAICGQIFYICTQKAYSISTECANTAVLVSIEDDIKYTDLIYVEKNINGDIVLMTTNSLKINTINRQVANATNMLLKNKISQGFELPIGAFTGVNFLSGYGSKIRLKLTNSIAVICDFSSNFTSVGINQTLHSIYIDVICTVNLHMPLNNTISVCKTQILISESVLVGKVPDIYLKDGLFS